MLTAKARLCDIVRDRRKHWIEDAVSMGFGRSKTSREERIMLTRNICGHCMRRFEGHRWLCASGKIKILAWMEVHWGVIHDSLDYHARAERES
jgi:hypothetical protein